MSDPIITRLLDQQVADIERLQKLRAALELSNNTNASLLESLREQDRGHYAELAAMRAENARLTEQRDAWAKQCNFASEHQAQTLNRLAEMHEVLESERKTIEWFTGRLLVIAEAAGLDGKATAVDVAKVVASLRADNARLRAALEPFGKWWFERRCIDERIIVEDRTREGWPMLNAGHFRAAAAALGGERT